jgi:hypothetical protein
MQVCRQCVVNRDVHLLARMTVIEDDMIKLYIKYMNEMEIIQDDIENFIIQFNMYENIKLNDLFNGTIIGIQVPKTETPDPYVADVGEKPTEEERTAIEEELSPEAQEVLKEMDLLAQVVAENTSTSVVDKVEEPVPPPLEALEHWNQMIAEAEKAVATEEPKTATIDMELIDALESAVTRLQDENDALEEEVAELRRANLTAKIEKHGYTSEGGIIRIADEQMSEEEFKNILRGSLYVQNEEQDQSGLWKKITEEQYIEQARKKNDNTDNAT